jgi:hypothetical protein
MKDGFGCSTKNAIGSIAPNRTIGRCVAALSEVKYACGAASYGSVLKEKSFELSFNAAVSGRDTCRRCNLALPINWNCAGVFGLKRAIRRE